MIRLIPTILFLLLAMGQQGKSGLEQITGLKIESGLYQFQDDGKVMVQAQGTNKAGIIYSIVAAWANGQPQEVWIWPEVHRGDL